MIVGIIVGFVSIVLILYEVFTTPDDLSDEFKKEHDECISAREANE